MKGIRCADSRPIFVSGEEFQRFVRRVKSGDIISSKIKEYCESLSNKSIRGDFASIEGVAYTDYIYGKHLNRKENDAQKIFAEQIVYRCPYSSYYGQETEEYIKTESFSNVMKSLFLSALDNVNNIGFLKTKLKRAKSINGLNSITLKELDIALKASKDEELHEAFKRYMFVLDGKGPVRYIKEKYCVSNRYKKKLALSFLDHFGINLHIVTINPLETLEEEQERKKQEEIERKEDNIEYGLLVEYIIAIYRMYQKYLPKEKNAYVDFIRTCDIQSHRDFVIKYKRFVGDGFSYQATMYENNNNKEETYMEKKQRMDRAYGREIFSLACKELSSEENSLEGTIKKLIYQTRIEPLSSKNEKN